MNYEMIQELRLFWKNYIFRSLLAILTIFVVLLFSSIEQTVIMASIGSTAFIIFAMPKNITAKPRNVIGGHLVGFFAGCLCTCVPQPSFFYSVSMYSLAVGLSILIMIVTGTEHPPASGTALGVAIAGFSLSATIAVITSVIILSLAHHFLMPFLKDLT